MPKKTNRQRMLARWKKCRNCFWCGVETIWIELPDGRGKLPDNAATIDHIRSRWSEQRSEKLDGTWQHGLWVLACCKCNNYRNAVETAFLALENPEAIRNRSNGHSAPKSLTRTQAKLCNQVIYFITHGGELHGDKATADSIRSLARVLKHEYERVREKRKAVVS